MESVLSGSLTVASMKITLNLPPELNWLIPYYEKKAEVRAKLGAKGGIEQEFLIGLEQYALQGLRNDPDFSILLGTDKAISELNRVTRENTEQKCDAIERQDDQ